MRHTRIAFPSIWRLVLASLFALGCYAPDTTHLLYSCGINGPCPSSMFCKLGACVVNSIGPCGSGEGVYLTEDNQQALCPNSDSTPVCANGFQSISCPEVIKTLCPAGVSGCASCCGPK